MDIALLSKMVYEIVLDHDEVTLPGLGSFVAEVVPASFSDKGYTINPPYRRLSFRPSQSEDTLLANCYAKANNISQSDASSILDTFLSQLKEDLQSRKIVAMPGLGRLRATRENNFFFVPDEDLNIYPEGFGLKPVSLKTHVETPEEVSAALDGLKVFTETDKGEETCGAGATFPLIYGATVPQGSSTDTSSTASAEIAPQIKGKVAPTALAADSKEYHEKDCTADAGVAPAAHTADSTSRKVIIAVASVAAAVVVFLGGFALLARIAPSLTDKLLYTEQELEILNYRSDNV